MRSPLWGYVFFVGIVILVGIIAPVYRRIHALERRAMCAGTMKGLSTAVSVYLNDYGGQYPSSGKWCDLLIQETDVSPSSFRCPLDPKGSFSYAINENLYQIQPGQIGSKKMIQLFEADLGRNGTGNASDAVFRHKVNGEFICVVYFLDGSMEFVTKDRIADLQWTVE